MQRRIIERLPLEKQSDRCAILRVPCATDQKVKDVATYYRCRGKLSLCLGDCCRAAATLPLCNSLCCCKLLWSEAGRSRNSWAMMRAFPDIPSGFQLMALK